jgi:serine/threonine-protein kinase
MALPPAASAVLARALALEPADRYQSAAEFSDAVAPLVGGAKHGIARLMQRLFAEEIRHQTGRHTA